MPDLNGTFHYEGIVEDANRIQEMKVIVDACLTQAQDHFNAIYGLVPDPLDFEVDGEASFAVGTSICVSWVFVGHTGETAGGWDFGSKQRSVRIRVTSTGRALIKERVLQECTLPRGFTEHGDGDIRYDSLYLQRQLGVEAIGRPLSVG